MHIIDEITVLHDSSNKYQHTDEVVISYKDIKLSLWINTETQYDNIKFAQLFFLKLITTLSLPANRKPFFSFLKMINSI